jgi:hypothetical protein
MANRIHPHRAALEGRRYVLGTQTRGVAGLEALAGRAVLVGAANARISCSCVAPTGPQLQCGIGGYMPKSRRQFLARTSLGLLGVAAARPRRAQKPRCRPASRLRLGLLRRWDPRCSPFHRSLKPRSSCRWSNRAHTGGGHRLAKGPLKSTRGGPWLTRRPFGSGSAVRRCAFRYNHATGEIEMRLGSVRGTSCTRLTTRLRLGKSSRSSGRYELASRANSLSVAAAPRGHVRSCHVCVRAAAEHGPMFRHPVT